MKRITTLSIALLCLAFVPRPLAAGTNGGAFSFSFTSNGGDIADNSVNVFAQEMEIPSRDDPAIPEIVSLELEVNGIRFDEWEDLDLYLIDPFGNLIEIMTDRGEGFSNFATGDPVDLTFGDTASEPPPAVGDIASGAYQPEGLANSTDDGFATYVGRSGGTDAWILLVIDDGGNPGGAASGAGNLSGTFDTWVLRGTAVPEPVTLSLLALGAVTILRRRHRRR